MEIRVEDDTDIVRNELGRIMTRIPEAEEMVAEEMMDIAVEEIRRSFDHNLESFTGRTRQQLTVHNVEDAPASQGSAKKLDVAGGITGDFNYLEWHEKAESGHFVNVSGENPPIKQWAEQNLSEIPRVLFVRPSPFIEPALPRIKRRIRQKVESGDNAAAELVRDFNR